MSSIVKPIIHSHLYLIVLHNFFYYSGGGGGGMLHSNKMSENILITHMIFIVILMALNEQFQSWKKTFENQ